MVFRIAKPVGGENGRAGPQGINLCCVFSPRHQGGVMLISEDGKTELHRIDLVWVAADGNAETSAAFRARS
jgi:hypothetical protein